MIIRSEERLLFPITSVDSFINLIDCHLKSSEDEEPNLAFLSILFGYLEHELTVNRISSSDENRNLSSDEKPTEIQTRSSLSKYHNETNDFPTLHLEIVEALLEHFTLTIKAQIDRSLTEFTTRGRFATKHLCKRISDIIWNGLLRSYHKDKAHIQSLFSYLTGKQLDCFGLALVVVAACQIFNYTDVHLVLSGDHAWATCGEDSKDMVEITWHGRGTEDRRGFVVDQSVMEKNWIYHGGKAMTCDRWMEVAALVVSINPSIDIHTESDELLTVQYKVLHMLYKRGHLDRYPMSLGILSDLEESLHPDCCNAVEEMKNKAIAVAQNLYDDLHVLPYCGLGNFYLRQGRCKEAIRCYAKAAQVVSKYNYCKDDEEIYKEMIDIASDQLPQALKEDVSLCEDPGCYYQVIRFYDGICLWEEGSSTPVLHSWWARHFTASLHRFSSQVRESFKDEPKDQDSSVSSGVSSTENDSSKSSSKASKPSGGNIPAKLSARTSGDSPKAETCSSGPVKSRAPVSKLHLRSEKMSALREMLTNGKKLSTQSIGLLLTAQSQVHFAKRKPSSGDYVVDYASKRVRRSRDLDG